MMTGLFKREPETLIGYTPKFSTEEACLFYRLKKVPVRHGFGMSDDEEEVQRYSYQHSVKVLDLEIFGSNNEESSYYGQDKFDIAAHIVNEYLLQPRAREDIKEWVKANAKDLNDDRRYWKARYHRLEIEKVELQIKQLQASVERAWVVHSLYATEVKQRRHIPEPERSMLLTEFNGDTWEPHGL